MILVNIVAIAASITTGLLLIYFLARIITVMRGISTALSTVRLLLKTVAQQTEDVPGYVVGIHDNVASLNSAVDQLYATTRSGGFAP